MSDTPETRQLAECDQYKVDEDYAEYNAYRRMIEHAQQMEMQRDAARGIVLACHRAFIGGSDFCQSEARRLSAELVRKISLPNTNTNMTTANATKSETQNIKLVITRADGTIRSQGYYWSAQEAILAAQQSGGYYTIRNTDTGKLIEAQW